VALLSAYSLAFFIAFFFPLIPRQLTSYAVEFLFPLPS
jgi:hypothetical protein